MIRIPILKFFVITDTHHTMKNPEHRLDNMFLAGLEKLNEVLEMTYEDDVESILLHVGDVFNSHNTSDTVAGIVGEYYKKFKQVIAVAGNHDIEGNNLSTLTQTKLGLFDSFGVMRIIKPYENIIIEREGVKIQLTGCSSRYGINNEEDMFIVNEKLGDISIHLVHAMLVSQDREHGSYMPLKRIQDKTLADITVSGDFHLGFDPVVHEGKVFVNPGALVRKYAFIEEMLRMPQVLQITVYNDKTFDYKLRPIKCAKKGEEVLDRSKIEETIAYDRNLEEYAKTLSFKEQESYDVDIRYIVNKFAEDEKLDKEISDLAIAKLNKAENALTSNVIINHDIGKKLKVTNIIAHNFQSHKHTEINNFHEHLNVIVGPTDSGKTTLFKRLPKWVFFNDLEGDFFIRDNDEGKTNKKGELLKESECYGTVVFNNDMQLTRKRLKSKNIYELIDENGELHEFENFDDKVPLKIQETIHMMKQVIDKDLKCNFNIPPKKEFGLVYAKNSDKAKIIGSFAGTNIIDVAIRDIQADKTNATSKVSDLNKDVIKLEKQIKAFGDMERREKLLKQAISMVEEIEELTSKLNNLKASKEIIDVQTKIIEVQNKVILKEQYVLGQEEYLNSIDKTVSEIIESTSKYEQFSSNIENITTLKEDIRKYDETIKNEKRVKAKEKKLLDLEMKFKSIASSEDETPKLEALQSIDKNIKHYIQVIEKQKVVIAKEESILSRENKLTIIQSKIDEISKESLETTYETLKQISLDIKTKKATISNLDIVLCKEKNLKEKENKLELAAQQISDILGECDVLVNQWKQLNPLKNSIKANQQKVKELDLSILEKEKQFSNGIESYLQDVIKFKKCPICLSILTPEHIKDLRQELLVAI